MVRKFDRRGTDRTHLEQTQHRIRPLNIIRVRRISKVPSGDELVTHHSRARHRRRIAAGEEVPDVHRRPLERVLQPERVDNEHRVVEVELRA